MVISKCRTPTEIGDLRNISSTMLPSKIYEGYVLNRLSTEVKSKPTSMEVSRGTESIISSWTCGTRYVAISKMLGPPQW